MQNAPIRLSRDAVTDEAALFGISWEVATVFVKTTTRDRVFRPLGLSCWEVICEESGPPFDSVVRPRMDGVNVVDLCINEDWPREVCSIYDRVDLNPHLLGRLHPIRSVVGTAPLASSSKWFGSGAEAKHAILVNQELGGRLLDANVAGLGLCPVRCP